MTRAWRWVGERALLRAFPDRVPESNAAARALAARIARSRRPEVEDLIPGARTLLVVLAEHAAPGDELLGMLEEEPVVATSPPADPVEIAVRYGGDDGPDLSDVAAVHGMTDGEVVSLHAGAAYTVGFIGFSPGFPYLLGMPGSIATPRLATPRTRIPKGSVGIGGTYTGVYPQATAGGWRLIGRTDVELFDATRETPALLEPGTSVRFVPA